MSTATKTKLAVSIGSDPELMLFDTQLGRIVSAIPVIKQGKDNPIDLGCGFRMYWDNVLMELAMPPVETGEQFIANFSALLKRAQAHLGKRYRMVALAAHDYHPDELKDPVALEIGCSPNFDVYTESMNRPAPFSSGLRTGSFHLHLGNKDYQSGEGKMLDFTTRNNAVKLLDIILGCGSVLWDQDKSSHARRALYGKAGEFRPTSYGIEYRVLGPYVMRSPELMRLMFSLLDYAVELMREDNEQPVLDACQPALVKEAINEGDKELAMSLLLVAGVPSEVLHCIEQVGKEPTPEMYSSWGINQ